MTETFPIVLSVLLLAVAIFALENAQAVTVRFLYWHHPSPERCIERIQALIGHLCKGCGLG